MESNIYSESITHEELDSFELSWFKGEIVVIDSMERFNNNFSRLLGSGLLGFDTETRPSFKKGQKNKVSLIQLANENLACLIRVNIIGIPEQVLKLLADPNVVKAGVAVHDDLRFLRGSKKYSPSGFVDLQSFVKDYGIQSSGLKKLAGIVLGFKISKRQQVTNWEAEELTEAQQIYAATDAWVCHQIYKKLVNGN